VAHQISQLVKMANQIALNFGAERDLTEASRRTAEHMEKFWTRLMREQLADYIRAGGEGVSPAVAKCCGGSAEKSE